MRAGRLPEDHPLEQQAREELRAKAKEQATGAPAQPRRIDVVTPEPPKPKRWE